MPRSLGSMAIRTFGTFGFSGSIGGVIRTRLSSGGVEVAEVGEVAEVAGVTDTISKLTPKNSSLVSISSSSKVFSVMTWAGVSESKVRIVGVSGV